MFRNIARELFNLIPAESNFLYKITSRYVDRYNGDNNSDPITNGEERLLRKILPTLRKGGVIFDVGANIGEWSKYSLSIDPNLSFHLFEPSKVTFERLSDYSWPENVKLNNFGLGEKKELLEMNIVDLASGMNSLHKRHGVVNATATAVEQVEINTLDEYCEKNKIDKIDFLKVDVEGHELAVLNGAQKMLKSQSIDLIQFEYGGCNLDARVYLLDIWQYLEDCGYHIAKIYPKSVHKLPYYSQELETFKYCNMLAYSDSLINKEF